MNIMNKFIDKLVLRIFTKIETELNFYRSTMYCPNCEHNCGKFLEWINKDGKKELKKITFCSEFKQREW